MLAWLPRRVWLASVMQNPGLDATYLVGACVWSSRAPLCLSPSSWKSLAGDVRVDPRTSKHLLGDVTLRGKKHPSGWKSATIIFLTMKV